MTSLTGLTGLTGRSAPLAGRMDRLGARTR